MNFGSPRPPIEDVEAKGSWAEVLRGGFPSRSLGEGTEEQAEEDWEALEAVEGLQPLLLPAASGPSGAAEEEEAMNSASFGKR